MVVRLDEGGGGGGGWAVYPGGLLGGLLCGLFGGTVVGFVAQFSCFPSKVTPRPSGELVAAVAGPEVGTTKEMAPDTPTESLMAAVALAGGNSTAQRTLSPDPVLSANCHWWHFFKGRTDTLLT